MMAPPMVRSRPWTLETSGLEGDVARREVVHELLDAGDHGGNNGVGGGNAIGKLNEGDRRLVACLKRHKRPTDTDLVARTAMSGPSVLTCFASVSG
jgi:hypothetical protein